MVLGSLPAASSGRSKRSRGRNHEEAGVHAAPKSVVRLLSRHPGNERWILVEVGDAEPVVEGGVDRIGDAGVRGEIDLELADARALLVRKLGRGHALLAKARDLVESRSDRGVAALGL